jgi:hypothetical protein
LAELLVGISAGLENLVPNPELELHAYALTLGAVALPIATYGRAALFPRKSFIEIVPDGIPARLRTAVSFKEISVVLGSPNSTFTSAIVIVPVGRVT